MSWKIENDFVDNGIFHQRNMDIYKGDPRTWETGFVNERVRKRMY